jgi:hypothetical protein
MDLFIAELQKLITFWNVLLVVGNWTIIHALRQSTWPLFEKKNGLPGWRSQAWRVKFWLPITGCVFPSLFVPGPWTVEYPTWGEKLTLGLVLGFGTMVFHHGLGHLGADDLIKLLTGRKTKPGA